MRLGGLAPRRAEGKKFVTYVIGEPCVDLLDKSCIKVSAKPGKVRGVPGGLHLRVRSDAADAADAAAEADQPAVLRRGRRLWGSRSQPGRVTCKDRQHRHDRGRVSTAAL